MLTVNGLHNFYYVPGVTDMRCGYHRLMQIVKHKFHRDPYSGDVFLFMSRDRRKVKMIHFEKHACYLHEKKFAKGYRFMKITYAEEDTEYRSIRSAGKKWSRSLRCPLSAPSGSMSLAVIRNEYKVLIISKITTKSLA